MMPRKRYRQYLDPGASRKIPRSTYYRWKRQGLTAEYHEVEAKRRVPLTSGGPNSDERVTIAVEDNPQQIVPLEGEPFPSRQEEESPGRSQSTLCTTFETGQESNSLEDHSPPRSDVSDTMSESSPSELGDVSSEACVGNDTQCSNENSFSRVDTDEIYEMNLFPGRSMEDEHVQLGDHGDVGDESTIPVLAPDHLNQPLVPTLGRTKFEAMLMVFHIAMRHGMTGPFLEDMLKFVNNIVGDDCALPTSKHLFQKLFTAGGEMVVQFFCPRCDVYLGPSSKFSNGEIVCDLCDMESTVKSMNGGNFFVTIGIREQLQDLLSRSHIRFVSPDCTQPGVIKDMMDGLIYKSLKQRHENALTITFNTDGAAMFKSSTKNSLWPLFFMLNEVHPEQRFLLENLMLSGLWFGSSAPNMTVFLEPFVGELSELASSGVVWKAPNGVVTESPVFAICCCTDSVAKPKVQNILQFNGSYGCGYCFHPHPPVSAESSHLGDDQFAGVGSDAQRKKKRTERKYVAKMYHYRSDRRMRKHMREADALSEGHIHGVKGTSILCRLPKFNIVFGFGIDYMHAALEGVMKKLAGLWFDSENHRHKFYIGLKINVVDRRLSTISPPTFLSRSTRPMSQRVHYKGNEWRSILLYYIIPCVKNVLPSAYFNHLRKFVTAIYILLKEAMTHEELLQAESLLFDFVIDFEKLYGVENMVYNVHLMTHLAKIVSMLGPLWAYSTFTFESGNGQLTRLVKGTTGVATSICRKYLMSSAASKLVHAQQYIVCDGVLDFCSHIIHNRLLINATKSSNVTLLGSGMVHTLTQFEKEKLESVGLFASHVHYYNRVVKNGIIYHGSRFTRQEKFNDSCVRLEDGSFASLELNFVLAEGDPSVWCFVRRLFIAEDVLDTVPHIKQCSLDPFGPLELMMFDMIVSKCILMFCDGKRYITERPNNYERD